MIIITGVTGWVGKTCIKYLIENYKSIDFENNVRVFGSKAGYLNINNKTIQVFPFELLDSDKTLKISHIFHTAFLTKEKYQKFGPDEYLEINKNIINIIDNLIKRNKNSRVVLTSSGAALPFLNKNKKIKKNEEDMYGILKAIEEETLSLHNNCLILRIFALTGYFIRSPEVFALSNFINSALNIKSININSKGKVIRSYGSAETIVELAWKWLFSSSKGYSINSTSHKLDLLQIANIISDTLGGIEINHQMQENILISDYSADFRPFNKKLLKECIRGKTIREQIEISISGFKSSLLNKKLNN